MSPVSFRPLPNPPSVAIVGATGAVGQAFLDCLTARRFPIARLRLLASHRSAGAMRAFRGKNLAVDPLGDDSFAGIDLALFSAGADVSKRYVPGAVTAGAVVVDNSSAFRMAAEVPLVVPEINAAALAGHRGVIANPNCAAMVALMAVWPIHRVNRIRRLTIATYQAASGAGAAAMAELEAATRAALAGEPYEPRVLPHPYAFNLFSHNSAVDPETGYNGEETKVMQEIPKILGDDRIAVSATCVRVPVMRAHAVALTIECERPVAAAEARALIAAAAGVRLVDDRARNHFPMPIEASGRDEILVGRIRNDRSDPSGRSLALFAAGDQLLKGAALNAVQIAERLIGAAPGG
jgi:aspartate-semialdehyde dehydrogenase